MMHSFGKGLQEVRIIVAVIVALLLMLVAFLLGRAL
jgi:hypothetical protein